ncbi:hypothetical protein [Paenibacillus psychroresistens]|nr:hypothetical protein [Paenibacillus psychroresistens]
MGDGSGGCGGDDGDERDSGRYDLVEVDDIQVHDLVSLDELHFAGKD